MPPSSHALSAFFLVGPTAVGKSAVAQWIAERHGYDILSADSMLVYRGMDIGTARPGRAERERVRHLGIDLVTPEQSFSVWDYRRVVLRDLEQNASPGRRTLVVGGTGLYVKSLTDGLGPAPGADPELRSHWQDIVESQGVEALQQELRKRNPDLCVSLPDKRNPRRLIRALERVQAGLDKPPRDWGASQPGAPLAGLTRPPAELKSRIESRIDGMYRQGLLDEVKALLERHGDLSPVARKAIGYEEAIEVLRGRCSAEEARRRTAARTWQLTRRQMTWFRHQADVRWLEIEADTAAATLGRRVMEHWREHGPTRIAD